MSRVASELPPFLGILDAAPGAGAQPVVAVLPVPYDGTSTWRKGADRGPAAILEASAALELYDIETDSEPVRRGFVTLAPVTGARSPEELVALVRDRVADILGQNLLPVLLGGEHSITIGAVEAAADSYGDLSVLQIDAHADTRESYEGSAYNHACVMARARERCPIVQVGIRSVDASEVAGLAPDRVFWAHEILGRHDDGWMDEVVDLLTSHVYVTIDLDAFDPSLMPATGTPEPGGLDWYRVNALLRRVASRRRVVGFDVVELLPAPGHHASAFTAAKLVYRFLAEIMAATPSQSGSA